MNPSKHHLNLCQILLSLAIMLCTMIPCVLLSGCQEIPDELRSLRERNPETADFVNAYETDHDKHHEIDLSGEYTPGQIPLFLQWDVRWGYELYGDNIIALTGCGPTCLSMVAVGLTGDLTKDPLTIARFSEEHGYYYDGVGSAWALISEGAPQLGLTAEPLSLDGKTMREHLAQGHPIICSVGPGDFTTEGHFIVLTGLTAEGRVTVNDPNSRINSSKDWDLRRIVGQVQSMWAISR